MGLWVGKILVDRSVGADGSVRGPISRRFGAIGAEFEKCLSTDPSDPSGAEISQNREEAEGESVSA